MQNDAFLKINGDYKHQELVISKDLQGENEESPEEFKYYTDEEL